MYIARCKTQRYTTSLLPTNTAGLRCLIYCIRVHRILVMRYLQYTVKSKRNSKNTWVFNMLPFLSPETFQTVYVPRLVSKQARLIRLQQYTSHQAFSLSDETAVAFSSPVIESMRNFFERIRVPWSCAVHQPPLINETTKKKYHAPNDTRCTDRTGSSVIFRAF